MVSWLGAVQHGPKSDVWYQNAALARVPLLMVITAWAWLALRSVSIKASTRQQFDIFSNPNTWRMTYLYIMTLGTFSDLSALLGLLMTNLYGSRAGLNDLAVQGYVLKDPAVYAFLGPPVGAGVRMAPSSLTDKMGGATWTLIPGIGLVIPVPVTILNLTPNKGSVVALDGSSNLYLWDMLAIFLFSGIGNASTFRQIPMIFESRQAGGVIGWTAAIATFGPSPFGVGVTLLRVVAFYWVDAIFVLDGVVITWQRYVCKGALEPSWSLPVAVRTKPGHADRHRMG